MQSVADLKRAEIPLVAVATRIGRRRLEAWRSAAVLNDIPGMDWQLAEALVRAGFGDIRSVADADPMDIFGAVEAARNPPSQRNLIPDDYPRIFTPGSAAALRQEAYWMVYGRGHARGAPRPAAGADLPPPMMWYAADPSNFGSANRSAHDVRFIVLHAMVGTLDDTRRYMQRYHANPDDRRSAHFLAGGDGTVIQMVSVADVAYHALNSGFGCGGQPASPRSGSRSDGTAWSTGPCNCQSIGIEMEDKRYSGDSGDHRTNPYWATTELYDAVAQLVRYLCGLYGIPRSFVGGRAAGEGILGHVHVAGRTAGKDDPQNWDWSRFMALVNPQPTPDPEQDKDDDGKGGGK